MFGLNQIYLKKNAKIKIQFQNFKFDLKYLPEFGFLHFEKLLDSTPTISYFFQWRGIIMGMTRLLLRGQFYCIYLYWRAYTFATECIYLPK